MLGSFSTRATLFVVATEERRVPNVHAINKVFMRHIMAQHGAVAIVSGEVAIAVVNAL